MNQLLQSLLLDNPLTLMQDKCDVIIDFCKKEKIKNLLEVGSFAGGSAYTLAKNLPETNVLSIDINNFDEYFDKGRNSNVKKILARYYNGYRLKPKDLLPIQEFYANQLTNLDITTATIQTIDIKKFDAIIVDGDHTIKGVRNDLEYIYKHNQDCITFIDDVHFEHILKEVEEIVKAHNLILEWPYTNNQFTVAKRKKN